MSMACRDMEVADWNRGLLLKLAMNRKSHLTAEIAKLWATTSYQSL